MKTTINTLRNKSKSGTRWLHKKKLRLQLSVMTALMSAATLALPAYAAPEGNAGEAQFTTVVEFFATWIGRIGLIVGFVGAIMLGLAIKKVFAGLTLKQVLSLVAALAVGVPLYIFGSKVIPEDMVSWAIIVICAPILAIGFVRFHNLSFIQLAQRFFFLQFQPQKRKYKELPVFWYAREQQNKEMLLKERELQRLKKSVHKPMKNIRQHRIMHQIE